MVIDVYIWLAYRLHALKRDTEVGWPALHNQFGAGFTRLRAFRTQFIEALELAAAVYPEARNLSRGERRYPEPVTAGDRQGVSATKLQAPFSQIRHQTPRWSADLPRCHQAPTELGQNRPRTWSSVAR